MEFDLGRKNWFVPFFRTVAERFQTDCAGSVARGPTPEATDNFLDLWLRPRLRDRGLLSGTPRPRWPLLKEGEKSDRSRAEWFFLNTLTHQLELLFELRLRHGRSIDQLDDQLKILSLFAAHVEEYETAEHLYELTLDDWGEAGDKRRKKLAKQMGPDVRVLGEKLKQTHLRDWSQPFFGLPFHHVLNYADSRQLMTIAHANLTTTGRIDEQVTRRIVADWHMEKVHLLEAVIALAASDELITSMEKRLIEHIIEMARLTSDEEKMVWQSLDNPMTSEALARVITDDGTRAFVFEQIVLNAHLDGEVSAAELGFIKKLAHAFGIDEEAVLKHEGEALVYLEKNPELIEAFSLGGLLRRFRSHVADRVESVVKNNLGRLGSEVRETGELGALLIKRAQGPLSEEEEEKVREQVLDICKTVPALAVFCAPGGSILLPIVMRLLPFNLMPSSFTEKDEAL